MVERGKKAQLRHQKGDSKELKDLLCKHGGAIDEDR